MNEQIFPVETHFLSIVGNDSLTGYLKAHLNDLVAYLDAHGLSVLASNQKNSLSGLWTVLAFPTKITDNTMYFATRTYLDECGLDKTCYQVETSSKVPAIA